MKKILLLFVTIITMLTLLCSCDLIDKIGSIFGDNGGTGDGGGTNNGGGTTGTVIWSEDTVPTLVFEEETEDITSLFQHIYQVIGIAPKMSKLPAAEADNEIIFGDAGRALSDLAYDKLDRYADLYSLESDGNSAYLIYAEGGNIAVAYSDTYSRYVAVENLIAIASGDTFAYDGVIAKGIFNTLDFIAERRNVEREKDFAAIEAEKGKDVADAIRSLYNLYGTELYYLIANLYDPAVGGFYYSVSGRDNTGYLPDIESTAQALNLVDYSGLSAGVLGVDAGAYGTVYYPNILPESMHEEIYNFALSLRAEDGYFYHPQWGTAISSSRKGRDQGWGSRMIAVFGQLVDETSVSSVSAVSYVAPTKEALTDKLLASDAYIAASKVLPKVDRVSAAFDLTSEATFKAFLDEGLAQDSYNTGNTINSNISAVKKAGLYDFLYEYLVEHQFDNGLWEEETSFNAINGLMKLCSAFDADHPFPNPTKAIESTIEVMTDPELEIVHVCYVYNPWVALYNVLPHCSVQDEAEFREMINDRAAELILNTFDKLSMFKKDDGGFSYFPDRTTHLSQMALVAVAGTAESDVNATGIAVSTVTQYMMRVLGIKAPELYHKFDTIYFTETLENLQPVIKKTFNTKVEAITFDDYDPSQGEEANGVVLYPDANAQVNIGNTTIGDDGKYTWVASSVIPNPAPGASPDDLVLRVIDYVYDRDGNGKIEDSKTPAEMPGTGSNVEFFIPNTSSVGECYVFEADLYFNSASATNMSDCLAQLTFNTAKVTSSHSTWMDVYSYVKDGKTYLRLKENWAGPDKVTDGYVVTGIPADEWFNLRIETYKVYGESGKLASIEMKFYLNGEYAGECDGGGYWSTTNNAYVDRVISAFRFQLYRHSTSEWYFNNVSTYKTDDKYVQEDYPAYIKPSDTEIYDFETDLLESNENITIVNNTIGADGEDNRNYVDNSTAALYNGGSFLSIAADPKNSANSVLKVVTTTPTGDIQASSLNLNPFIKDKDGQLYVVDFDYYLEADANTKAGTIASFKLLYGTATADATVQAIYKPAVITDLNFRPGNIDKSSFNILNGQWVKIKTVIDAKNKTLTTFVSLDGGATWTNYMKSDVVIGSDRISAVQLTFDTGVAENRVQYVDNLSLTMIKELYLTLTNGEEKTYGVPLTVVPSDTKVYDFESGTVESNSQNIVIYNPLSSDETKIDSNSTATGTAGSFLSIATDPENGANKVLKNFVNNGTSAKITINPYIESENGKIMVLDFDHYYAQEEESAWQGIGHFIYNFSEDNSLSTQGIYKPTLSDSDNDGKLDIMYRGGNISNAELNISGKQWIKIRAVLDLEAKTQQVYMSSDGGDTWVCCSGSPVKLNESEVVSVSIQFTANVAKNRIEYFDNISFVKVDGISMNIGGTETVFGEVK
nr:hypothetical protein [Oscillospiraceae bacterium]